MYVKKGFDGKRDGLTTSRGQYSKLMGGISAPKTAPRKLKDNGTTYKSKNGSPMVIGRRPPMSLAIASNLLTPNIRAIDLRISATIATTKNNSKNLEDGSFSMKHPERCS